MPAPLAPATASARHANPAGVFASPPHLSIVPPLLDATLAITSDSMRAWSFNCPPPPHTHTCNRPARVVHLFVLVRLCSFPRLVLFCRPPRLSLLLSLTSSFSFFFSHIVLSSLSLTSFCSLCRSNRLVPFVAHLVLFSLSLALLVLFRRSFRLCFPLQLPVFHEPRLHFMYPVSRWDCPAEQGGVLVRGLFKLILPGLPGAVLLQVVLHWLLPLQRHVAGQV